MKFAFALSFASFALAAISSAQPSYEFHTLSVPGSDFSSARAINSRGVVAGFAQFSDGHSSAGTWTKGKWTALSTPGATDSFGYGINDPGDVVGIANIGGVSHAALWRRGKFVDLGASQLGAGTIPRVWAVNNAGVVAGFDHDLNFEVVQAWTWSNGVKQNVPGPFGTTAAYAINNRGCVAGGAFYAPNAADAHPTLYRDGQEIDLGDAFGGEYSYATGINDSGQVTGGGGYADGTWNAFLWDKGVYTALLPVDASLGSEALGINDQADVVGDCFDYFVDFSMPTVWHKGVPIALGPEGVAYSVNNQGTVVGFTPAGACYWSLVSHH